MTSIRVTAIQARPVSETAEELAAGGDVAHAVELLERAKADGADIACFPELYPRAGEKELTEAARRLGIWVVAGLVVPAGGSRAHNTATFISADGAVVARQPKVFPTQGEIDNGIVAGAGYEVVDTPLGRLGAVICADFAFTSYGIRSLTRSGVDIVFNPSWWFALGEAYAATVIGRHLEYGIPVVGVDIARVSIRRKADGQDAGSFPPAGGHSVIAAPPNVADLAGLASWFRTKPGGVNSEEGFVHRLGELEEVASVDIDVEAVRRFPGYFFNEAARQIHERELVSPQ